ncbi:MAG: Holliday junction branch migration protein RuvA [Blastocatellia bacterium AA13]|nr:MAG: Holliday junction branch migration protein RuvA [Blastocatellia bacterium AA13]
MIANLTGKLTHKQPSSVVIDVGGVGYEVTIPLSTFYELGEVGSSTALRIHTHVREDALQLFGFKTAAEKEMFSKLTSVSGVGPKLAITILSGVSVADLAPAIMTNNLEKLTAIPGVGKKTAERLVIELRDKIASIQIDRGDASPTAFGQSYSASSDLKDDTVAALTNLGYPKAIAERAVGAAIAEPGEANIEAVLRRALKRLSR